MIRKTVAPALRALVTAAFVAMVAAGVYAQSSQGSLRGVVKDAQGVIPGVPVSLVNESTNIARETVTNESGEYSFPAVEPSTYTIKASVAGFRAFERKGVRIGTQQNVGLDIVLEVGTLEETITVTADAPLIESTNASVGGVIDTAALEAIPDRRPQRVPHGHARAHRAGERQRALEPHAGPGGQLGGLDGRRPGPRRTTSWWTASRSPTSRTAPRRTRRWKRCRR